MILNAKGNYFVTSNSKFFVYFNEIGSEQLTFYVILLTDYLSTLGSFGF